MRSVRLALLGRPAVSLDGVVRPWPATRPDALLTLLAVRGGWLRREELALRFRGDRRDAEARAWVRQALHRAGRRPWAVGLEHDGDAVRWIVASDLAELRSALEVGDAAGAVAAAHGPLLLDWDPGDPATAAWLDDERARLLDAWCALVVPWALRCESSDDADAALAAYRAWQRLDPDDAEALQGELRTLHATQGATAARRRYRSHARDVAAALGAAPSASSAWAAQEGQATLPVPTRRCVGRDRLRDDAVAFLSGGPGRWLALHGRAGMGASSLGLEIAWAAAEAFPGGAVPLPERALGGRDAFDDALAEALGLPGASVEAVARRLRRAPTLLWLDAGEHDAVSDATPAPWLARAPAAAWLWTGRRPTAHPQETAWELAGLEPAAARTLFLERAVAADPTLVLTDADDAALDELVRHVGGWPLALEVAAGWLATVPLLALAERLDPLLYAATSDDQAPSPVTSALDAAHDYLAERDANALATLAAFAGPFGADAAEAVAGSDALPSLLRLRRLGLVDRGVDGRHRLHPLVAADAARRRPDAAALGRERHRRWWAIAARAWARRLRGGDPAAAAREVDEAATDLLRALDHTLAGPPTTDVLDDAFALAECRFQHASARGREREAAPSLAAVARRLEPGGDAHARARVLGWWAYADVDAPFVERAARLETARTLAEATPGASAAAAFAVLTLANLWHRDGRPERAGAAAETGVARAEAAGDAHLAAWGAHLRGVVGFALGEPPEAIAAWFGRSLAHATSGADLEARSLALANLGELALAHGDFDTAEARYLAALDALRSLEHPRLTAVVTGRLGRLALRRGDPDAAVPLLNAAAATLDALADDRGWAAVARDRAAAALACGDHAAARRDLRRAVTRALDGGEHAVALDAAIALADLEPDAERATAWLRTLLAWATGVHDEAAAVARDRLAAREGAAIDVDRDDVSFDDEARHRLRAFAAA